MNYDYSCCVLLCSVIITHHLTIFCVKISQSSSSSLSYPFCPLLKPVPADSLPGVPIPRRHARCHQAKRAHVGCEETRCQLGRRITLGATERIPDGGMCDISWLPSLSSRQSWRPQLCLHMLTGYVTRCPSDTFAGRESEYEMIHVLPLTLPVS